MYRRPGWAPAERGEGRGGTGGLAELRAALLSRPLQRPIQPLPQSTRLGESGEQSGAGQAHSVGTALCPGDKEAPSGDPGHSCQSPQHLVSRPWPRLTALSCGFSSLSGDITSPPTRSRANVKIT